MGTPGDKTQKFGKVVRGESQPELEQPPQRPSPEPPPPETSLVYPTTSAITGSTPQLPLPEMGFYQHQPEQGAEKGEQYGVALGQSTLEDYYVQSKSYTENLPKYYAGLTPPRAEPKLLPGLDQPGPSGLQTPKSKTSTSTTEHRLKKERKESSDSPKKVHECEVCQKTFPNAAKLARHQNIHGGSSPFKCEHCKKSFSSRFKLVRHALIHSDRKPYSCQVCERTFHRKDHLKNHIKVHSPQKKVYVCLKPACKKEYTSLLSFRKHLALHAAEEGSLECQICFDTFETKEDILYHLKVHAGSRTVKNPNEKKFKCSVCDRRFFTNKDVRRHLVVHTGMRDFLCQFCPQRFGRKDHLVRHIKKSHAKQLPPEAQKGEESEVAETESKIVVKTEFPETSYEKSETVTVKSEAAETTLASTSSEPYSSLEFMESFGDSSLLFSPSFEQLNPIPSVQYLPSTSVRSSSELESSFLESLGEGATEPLPLRPSLLPEESLPNPADINPQILEETVLLPDSEIMRLLQEGERVEGDEGAAIGGDEGDEEREEEEGRRKPLPPFSQTFQSPPPPP